MNVLIDQWTPLFGALESRVSSQGRTRLLFNMIADVYEVTYANFGAAGQARPSDWPALRFGYAQEKHGGDQTPTLILTGALRDGFVHEVTDKYATLTNTVEYADDHQFGVTYKKLPARPYYPVDESGLNFTPYMEARLSSIVENHFRV